MNIKNLYYIDVIINEESPSIRSNSLFRKKLSHSSYISKHNINVVNSVKNKKNSKLIIKGKDNLPKDDKMNIVYIIECDNCSVVYVGQTKGKISLRIKEHFNNISHRSHYLDIK